MYKFVLTFCLLILGVAKSNVQQFDITVLNFDKLEVGSFLPHKHASFDIKMLFEEFDFQHLSIKSKDNIYFLGVFYGCILIMMIYNFLLFLYLKDRSHLFYVFYMLFTALFFASHDGIGPQYLWSSNQAFFKYLPHLSISLQVIFFYLYTRFFLQMNETSKKLNYVFMGYSVFRFIFLFTDILGFKTIFAWYYADIPLVLITYIAAFIALRKGHRYARFFIVGVTFIFTGFLVFVLRMENLIATSTFTYYLNYATTLLEMLMLSLALGDKFNRIKENESLQTEINKVLEAKVSERTQQIQLQKQQIEEKVKDLDTLIYKSSHDLKGPLKSVMGLLNLVKLDPKNSTQYYEQIQTTVQKLDLVISGLINSNRINSADLVYERLDIYQIVNDCTHILNINVQDSNFYVSTKVQLDCPFYSNKEIIHSIFQNIIENAFKYRKPNYENSQIKITGLVNEDYLYVDFTDNGIGIDPDYIGKIFDMFMRADINNKGGSGLGLYLTKTYVQKLGGQIDIKSELGFGTILSLQIPNRTVNY